MQIIEKIFTGTANFTNNGTSYTTIPGLSIVNFSAEGHILIALEIPYAWNQDPQTESWYAIAINNGIVREGVIKGSLAPVYIQHHYTSPRNISVEGQLRTSAAPHAAVAGLWGQAFAALRIIY